MKVYSYGGYPFDPVASLLDFDSIFNEKKKTINVPIFQKKTNSHYRYGFVSTGHGTLIVLKQVLL